MNMHRPYDSRLELRAAGSAALTATATLATFDQTAAVRTEFNLQGFLEAVKISANNELYRLVVELSDDDFVTVNEVALIKDFGATEVRQSGAPDSAATDEFDLPFTTEMNGVSYRYWRVRMIISGTSPSITFNAFATR